MILTGAGQIGMAIARRMGYGMKIIVGDRRMENAMLVANTMNQAGFDAMPVEMDLATRSSILALIEKAQTVGDIKYLVNAAGVSPSQASIETILKVDLYGTAVLLEEVGKVIKPEGAGITISSQSGHRLPALGEKTNRLLACTPTEKLLDLDVLQPQNIRDTLHAYQLSKRCNNALWRRPSNGANEAHASTPSRPASSSHRLPSTNSTGHEAIFTKTCLPNVQQAAPAQPTKWRISQSC